MIGEFRSILEGDRREVTIDYSAPNRDRELSRLKLLESVSTIGDVGFYYLPYVPLLAELELDIRMPCIQRNRAATIASFMEKVRIRRWWRAKWADWLSAQFTNKPYYQYQNHWVDHDGQQWQRNSTWDKLYPKFSDNSLESSIGQYWDYYYKTAEEFSQKFPNKFRIFEIDDLNSKEGQGKILKFCGLEDDVIFKEFHVNKKIKVL